MAATFRDWVSLPPVSDAALAKRTLEDLPSALIANERQKALLEAAAGNSPYLARLMVRESGFLMEALQKSPGDMVALLTAQAREAAGAAGMAEAMAKLRVAKRRLALAVALGDIGGLFSLEDVTGALARFADAAISGALRFLLAGRAAKAGIKQSAEELEATTGLIVLAMGKHGAFELNYSSDIDLVIFFDEKSFPFLNGGEKTQAAIALVKDLVKLIHETTPDGYVFRTDLRLRPDAGATQVAIAADAALGYYEQMGQNWERAAFIKARPCAGDKNAAANFLRQLSPFLWRRNLDYAAIADIHSIKRQINAHGGHSRIAVEGHNIKLGRGGIREIEFFAQTQQLILGGRDPSLRVPGTLDALRALFARKLISEAALDELGAAYRFHRMVEHRLQMIDDAQTHTLPKDREGLDRIARFCGYAETQAFEKALLVHLGHVQAHYAKLFESEAPLASQEGSLVFTGVENDPETLATLTSMGFTRASDVAAVIRSWHHGRIRATRGEKARELLTKLVPLMLAALAKTADPDTAFFHFDRFVGGLPAGVQSFSLFLANPRLLDLVASIVGSAPRLASYLGHNPGVLDAMIDSDFLESLPGRGELADDLHELLQRFTGFEGALDAARRFAREETFRIGVHVIEGLSSAEEAGPAYAAVAETAISVLQPVVEAEMTAAHGRIAGGAFAVVAQGKLGGREMTAASDLDLVFVYTHDSGVEASDGAKPLAPSVYFTRMAHRFIAALTAQTGEGKLYEVDMRLRPSGNQGPVAVKLDTFVTYHHEHAWTWERMALTRARVLSGPASLRAAVNEAVRSSLTRAVEAQTILGDAAAMREKLAQAFPGRDPWDIKFAPGGLVDIEFIAQALQLVHAPKEPDVLDANTILALDKLASIGGLRSDDAQTLIDAAKLEHALTQVLRIAIDGTFKPEQATRGLKALLIRAARAADYAEVEARLSKARKCVRTIFTQIFPATKSS